jgi:rod shape-determining protein MreD
MGAKFFASVIPVLLGLIGALVANMPLTLMGGWMPPPLFALMPIYFWSLMRPDLVSPGWVLLIGIVQDILAGSPPGIWTASFVAMYAALDYQREAFAGLSGLGAILGFATATLITSATAYLLFTFYFWRFSPLAPFVMQFAVTVLLYVPAAIVLDFIHRRCVGPLRSDP